MHALFWPDASLVHCLDELSGFPGKKSFLLHRPLALLQQPLPFESFSPHEVMSYLD
jgi:hypothetical protein